VDSAGALRPPEVQEYVRAVREESGLEVGLHAHNNSGLAVANSLAAVAAGATLVDGSLQGIGRATGNPPTEQLLLGLQRLGHEKGTALEAVMRLGERARQLFAEKGNPPIHYASGAARLHSRYVAKLLAVADERRRARHTFLLQLGAAAEQRGLLRAEQFPAD